MLKKDTLYTANKWNQPLFTGEKAVPSPTPNLYEGGGFFNSMLDRWASKAYGDRYGDKGYTLTDYKANLGSQLGAATTVASPFLSGVIGGGYSTGGVGEGIATVGNTVGEFMPDPISKAAVKVGSAVVGGIYNRLKGVKENKQNTSTIKENTNVARAAGNALASANDRDSFLKTVDQMTVGSGFGAKDLYKNGLLTNKGTKMGNELINKENNALAYQNNAFTTGAKRVDDMMDDAIMNNFAAFGGPLGYPQETGMGAIDYGFMSDYSKYLMTKGKQNQGKSGVSSFTAPSILALGGPKGGDGKTYKGRTVPYLARRGWPSSIAGIDAMRRAGFTDAEIDDWMINHQGATGYKRLSDNTTHYVPQKSSTGFGGSKGFVGAGAGGDWTDPYQPTNTKNFNEAFDEARKAGAEDFWFGGKRYNTIMEANPIREFNNRHVGAGRTPEQIEKREGYGRDYGPINNKYAALPIIPYAEGGPLFALGGDIQRGGADFTTGLAHVDAGGSHEENPYQGVQMGVDSEGVPNLVEEGEVVFNDYVYSKRINLDEEAKKKFHFPKKKELSYADAAKRLEKEISERPNDPISKAAFKAQMETLANEQERQKQEMEAARAREAFEALSPEEQSALMQQVAQQEQMAQEQAIQEQAMAAQQAQEQPMPVNPEEVAMMQQEAPTADAMGTVAEPQMACGGKLRKYDKGGVLKLLNSLGYKTVAEAEKAGWKPGDFGDFKSWNDIKEDSKLSDTFKWSDAFTNRISDPVIKAALSVGWNPTSAALGRTWYEGDNGNNVGWTQSVGKSRLNAKEFKDYADRYKNTLGWALENGKIKAPTGNGTISMAEITRAMREAPDWKKTDKWLYSDIANQAKYLGMARGLNPDDDTKFINRWSPYGSFSQGDDGNWVFNFNDGLTDAERAAFTDQFKKTRNDNMVGVMYNNFHDPGTTINRYVLDETGKPTLITDDDLSNYEQVGDYTWGDAEKDLNNQALFYRLRGAYNPRTYHTLDGDDDYLLDNEVDWNVLGDEIGRETLPNGDVVIRHIGKGASTGAAGTGEGDEDYEWEVSPNYKNDKLRYAGIFGPAVGLGMQALGIGRPDTKKLEGVLDMYNRQGAVLGDYMPIGNYLRYTPMDIWAEQNRMHSNARAAGRAILNSGANQGSKMAGLVANNYGEQMGSGDLYRKALEYNDVNRERTAAFNKDTDKFNADAYNRLSLQNAEIMNRNAQMKAQLGMQAASQKLDADAGWYNGIYGNVGGIFKGLSDIGKENAQHNMIAEMAADGIFGKMSPQTNTGRRGKYLTFYQVPKKK